MTTIAAVVPQIQQGSEAVQEAARRLRRGDVVVIPTETVYGLAGSTHDPAALARIFALKGRPADNPLIAHVDGIGSAKSLTSSWPSVADVLAKAFWPGPLTMVLPRNQEVPAFASAGLETIAIRVPHHPVAQAILEAAGGPLSAASANRSGRVSPTTAAHVHVDYQGVEDATNLLIVEGGPCEQGIESTVIDLSGDHPRLLRPGTVSRVAIESIIGPLSPDPLPGSQDASPGTRAQHYAPSKPVRACVATELPALLLGDTAKAVIGMAPLSVPPPHTWLQLPNDSFAAGHLLYGLLRQADDSTATKIVVVLPTGDQWEAVRDRLTRASAS
jgi:L-threonylcarbamoyladenylate synthase